MLSRTADHLFWMARYMERAENTARMLDINSQGLLLPQTPEQEARAQRSVLRISELEGEFRGAPSTTRIPAPTCSISWSRTRTIRRASTPACTRPAKTPVPCAAR